MSQLILLSILVVVVIGAGVLLINRNKPREHTQPEIDLSKVFEANKLVGYADVSKVQVGLDGRNRMDRFKEKVFPVVISRSEKQLVIKFHESILLKDIRMITRSLGADLFNLGIFPTANIFVSSADKLDTYVIKCLTDEETLLMQLVRKSGLVKKDTSNEEVWPEIEINERGIIQLKSYLLNHAEVEKAAPDFNQLGRTYEIVKQQGSVFTISPIGAFEQFLGPNETVFDKKDKYLERFVNPYKSASPRWFLGINQITGEEEWRPLINNPALLVLGASGGGKTATAKSILYNLIATHPDTILYLYDGKGNADWLDFADNLSPHPLGVPVEGSTALQAFFLIDKVFQEYLNRIELFRKVKANNIDVYQQKTGVKLPTIILLLEEFPHMANELNFKTTHTVANSPAYKLKRLIQESRSYGFGYLILSQSPTVEVVPNLLLNNMIKVVHKSFENVANTLGLPGATTLKKGQFYTKGDEGAELCQNLFLGDQIERLFEAAGLAKKEKVEIDPNFVQPTGAESERSEFAILLKAVLIKQSFKVVNWDTSNHSSAAGVAKLSEMSLKIAFLKKDELSALHIKSINDSSCTHLLVLCEFAIDEKKELELIKRAQEYAFGENKVIFITDTIWKRLVYQALETDSDASFSEFIKSRSALLTLIESASPMKENGFEDVESGEIIADKDITIERLNSIKALKGKGEVSRRKKGKAFEAFIAGLFIKKGFDAIFDAELKRQKYTFPQKGDGDGGLDLVVRKGAELCLIQAKNWSWEVGNEAVQQILAAAATLKGTRNEVATKLIVIAASDFTPPARAQAQAAGVELWNYARLIQEVKEFSTEKRGRGRPKKAA